MTSAILHRACLGLVAFAAALAAHAQTLLADQPLFAAANVPGNMAVVLSVEFPTAVSVAHTNRSYSSGSEYLGYFDPNKCYGYRYTDGTSTDNYFYPAGAASVHVCSGKWSGNFLNWASMQTIDPFRWALTGGYRVIDQVTLTVIEKAWATGQGGTGNFPDSSLPSALIAGATPFPASTQTLGMRIQGLGNKMRFTVPDTSSPINFTGQYWNNQTETGAPVLTRTDKSINFNWDSSQPDPLVNHDNISARWTGTVTAPSTGLYTFRVRADDTVKLTINGVQVVNQTAYDGLTNHFSPSYPMIAGQTFNVQVDFSQGGGGSSVVLEWSTPTVADYTPVGGGLASLYGAAVAYNGSATAGGVAYEAFMRAKVCDPSVVNGGVETNCVAYGANYKPEGLMQKYANKIRYSAFGYLNDSNILRDGGVMRAQQKFVGPMRPVPGSVAVANAGREWDSGTGIFAINPDTADAANTAAIMGLPVGSEIVNSGVINYINKFGEITPGSYKTYDNVSELYYAAIRYFKNLPAVPEWTATGGADNATKVTWTDGFPVITAPADPILYSCQRNFILGIGDVNTHADKNLPGRVQSGNEPALPAAVAADTSVNATLATDKVGALEGMGPIGTNASYNTSAIAGLAYDSHTKDIRPDLSGQPNTIGLQTIDTYWVDVQEYQAYAYNNQFYLATKYGGFTVPLNYDPYNNTTPLPLAWWSTSGDTNSGQPRPDNYFLGGRPDLMQAGLNAAFARISAAISAFTTSFSTSLPQVALSGNSSFSSKYDANTWTGELTASNLSFDSTTGNPVLVASWNFTDVLGAQLAGTGWNTNRRVISWNGSTGVAFRASGTSALASSDLATLDTTYVLGDDRVNYLNYMRGDTTNEVGSTVTGSTHAYRTRAKLLGDIVGSKAAPAGPPSFPFSDTTNAGYSSFKSTWASRRTVVYVGSNDGMLHAVNGALTTVPTPGLESDPQAGTEMFAYVPRALYQGPNNTPSVSGLASVGNPSFTHHYLVNATPNVYDIDFGKTQGNYGSPDWHSVLIGGLGKGGRGYYAIDVTDPQSMAASEGVAASKVLWELTDSKLGYSYGAPVVAKTRKYGWVAIFPSGYNNLDGQGYFLFVNPRNGQVLERVATGVGSVGTDAGLANANAFIVDATDGTADSVYAGDLLGNLWRVDLTAPKGDYPAAVRIATLTDAGGAPQPVTSRPAIEIHPSTKKRFVMVGTGKLLDSTDIASVQGQSFYAITDGTNAAFNTAATLPTPLTFPIGRAQLANNATPVTGVSFNPATQMGWYEDLGAWRVTSDSTTLAGSVAFASTLPNGSVCSPSGDSRVYAREYSTAATTLRLVGNDGSAPLVSYIALPGNVTDLRYLSVGGKPALIAGTDTGSVVRMRINPNGYLILRRLNWRELPVVD